MRFSWIDACHNSVRLEQKNLAGKKRELQTWYSVLGSNLCEMDCFAADCELLSIARYVK